MFHLEEAFPETKALPVTTTFMDRNSNIWFCTDNHQYIFNGKNKKYYRLASHISGKIICITQGAGHLLYIATEHKLYTATFENDKLDNVTAIHLPSIRLINYDIITLLQGN